MLAKFQPLRIHEDICVFSNNGKAPVYNPILTNREKPIKHGGNKCLSESAVITYAKPEYDGKVYDKKQPESIIYCSTRSEKRGLHPTQKPVRLLEYLIKTYSNERDVILDNCMGSGSTGVACRNTNRRFIGIELDPKYFEIAYNRIYETKP